MNRFEEFAKHILHVDLDMEFRVVDKNGILVNEKKYRVNKDMGLQVFDEQSNDWRKVSGIYEHFIEGVVKPTHVKLNKRYKISRQDILSESAMLFAKRENFKQRVYSKILHGYLLKADEVSALVYKTPSTIYHWEQEGIVPPAKKNDYGRRIYDFEGLCEFLEAVKNHEWKKSYNIDIEEINAIYDYLIAKKDVKKTNKRNKNANPYEYKGV